jgi:predicted ArsR family transcriptional regulator
LFARQDEITTSDAARILGLSERQVRNLLNEWVTAGWLEVSNSSRKARAYRLKAEYRQFIGNLSAK